MCFMAKAELKNTLSSKIETMKWKYEKNIKNQVENMERNESACAFCVLVFYLRRHGVISTTVLYHEI